MKYRINYSKVISQANSISNDASELSAQIRLLEQMEQDCRSAWSGQAADAFIAKLRILRSEMSRTKSQISSLASTIKILCGTVFSVKTVKPKNEPKR